MLLQNNLRNKFDNYNIYQSYFEDTTGNLWYVHIFCEGLHRKIFCMYPMYLIIEIRVMEVLVIGGIGYRRYWL